MKLKSPAISALTGIIFGSTATLAWVYGTPHLSDENVVCQDVQVVNKDPQTFTITAWASGDVTNYTFVITDAAEGKTTTYTRGPANMLELAIKDYGDAAYTVQAYIDGVDAKNITSDKCQRRFRGSSETHI